MSTGLVQPDVSAPPTELYKSFGFSVSFPPILFIYNQRITMSKHTKQVRFAHQTTVYPPQTSISAIAVSFSSPSSSSSGSSILSSHRFAKKDGLPVPTPYVFPCAPQPKALEPVEYDRHGCHPLLETSAITYDLRNSISTAKTGSQPPLSVHSRNYPRICLCPSSLAIPPSHPPTCHGRSTSTHPMDHISPSKIFLALSTQLFIPI